MPAKRNDRPCNRRACFMESGSDRLLPSRLFPKALCSDIFIPGDAPNEKKYYFCR